MKRLGSEPDARTILSIITLTKHTPDSHDSAVLPQGGAGAPAIELVAVTPEMEAAGLERARELVGENPGYVVAAVYLAMEYERLYMNGQLSGLDKQALKVRHS